MNKYDTAYFEDTTEGLLKEMGYSDDFINWLSENEYYAYDSIDRWIHFPERKLYSLEDLKKMYEQNVLWKV